MKFATVIGNLAGWDNLELFQDVVYLKEKLVKYFRTTICLFFALTITIAQGQNYFQRNRKAFQKARYNQTTKKYGKACSIFEKKRTKGERKPLISLGRSRKSKKKMAEQD